MVHAAPSGRSTGELAGRDLGRASLLLLLPPVVGPWQRFVTKWATSPLHTTDYESWGTDSNDNIPFRSRRASFGDRSSPFDNSQPTLPRSIKAASILS